MPSDDGAVLGIKNLGNTCFLNAVLQALASSRATVDYLQLSASSAAATDIPLANAVSECLSALAHEAAACKRSISPKPVLEAFREYIPADCLRDGEQNDSAEVLELLCSTLALEQSKQTSDIGRALHQAQLPWICIARLLSASLSDDCVSAANNKAVHNIVCQMANIRQDKDPLSNGSSSFPDPDLCTSSSESNAGDSSTSAEASGVWEGEPHSGRMPLEGNTVNDMTCTKCRHSFVSQHSPFHVLPLALPSAKVSARLCGNIQVQKTVVARNTNLMRCLAEFCGLEVLHGVHCPRCTLQSATEHSRQAGLPSQPFTGKSGTSAKAPAQRMAEEAADTPAAPSVRLHSAAVAEAAKKAAQTTPKPPQLPSAGLSNVGAVARQHACILTEAEEGKRGIIEGLLQSTAPWPDMDYEQLAKSAGHDWQPVGSSCIKRISIGRPPKALCLHLRRAFWTSTGHHLKLSGHINFPLSLDITPYSAANMLPLSSLGQQYMPSASQTHWMGTSPPASLKTSQVRDSLADATVTLQQPRHGKEAGRGICKAGGASTSADGAAAASAEDLGEVSASCDGAITPHDIASVSATPSTASQASAAAEQAHSAQRVEPGKMGVPADKNLILASAFASPAAAAAMESMDHADSPEGDESSMAGQVAAPGPVQRLLASHALSLASSLTSESSLLDAESLSHVASTTKPHEPSMHTGTTAAESLLKKAASGRVRSSNSTPRAGQAAAAGPLQRVLASHALSLASSLMSEGSVRDDDTLDDAANQTAADTDVAEKKAKLTSTAVHLVVDGRASTFADAPCDAPAAAHGNAQAAAPAAADNGADARCGAAAAEANTDSSDFYGSAADAGAGADESKGHGGQNRDSSTPDAFQSPSGNRRVSPCPTERMDTQDEEDQNELDTDTFSKEHADSSSGQVMVYHLTAAVVHHGGSSGGGHYTVYRRVVSGQDALSQHAEWFSISDETVHRASVHDVLACEAALLMYEQ